MALDNIFNKFSRKKVEVLCFIVASSLFSGCQTNLDAKRKSEHQPSSLSTLPSPSATESKASATTLKIQSEPEKESKDPLSTCRQELFALSKINKRYYNQKNTAFSYLLSRADTYQSVRENVGEQTRDTVDALYKYKTQKLCLEIEQTLRQALITKVESFK